MRHERQRAPRTSEESYWPLVVWGTVAEADLVGGVGTPLHNDAATYYINIGKKDFPEWWLVNNSPTPNCYVRPDSPLRLVAAGVQKILTEYGKYVRGIALYHFVERAGWSEVLPGRMERVWTDVQVHKHKLVLGDVVRRYHTGYNPDTMTILRGENHQRK